MQAARLRQQDWARMQATLHAELQAAMRDYADRLTAVSQRHWAPLSTVQVGTVMQLPIACTS